MKHVEREWFDQVGTVRERDKMRSSKGPQRNRQCLGGHQAEAWRGEIRWKDEKDFFLHANPLVLSSSATGYKFFS